MKSGIRIFGGIGTFASFVIGGCVSMDESKSEPNPVDSSPLVAAKPLTPKSGWEVAYENDFSSYAVGEEPTDLFILDGDFSVRVMKGNKVLSLPGSPISDFGILFGPRIKNKPMELQCRVLSTRKGRRMPAFVLGLGGLNGFRLRVDCAAGKLRLIRGEDNLSEEPFDWKSGTWTQLRFRAVPMEGQGTKILAKAWDAANQEPPRWMVVHEGKTPFAGGKCVLWGVPYASSKILFDDLKIFSLGP